jgi:hypothetical protein
MPTYEHYITLSYCWGPPPFLTTTLANIGDHKKSMKVAELPQTIQDAIIVTRGLGLRYVWIDAVCIIQDSFEDKVKEIKVMGNIYHHSTLTVAAVSAAAVAEGFLRTKPRPTVKLPYLCPDGSKGTVQLALQRMVDLWQETMYTRGWCLQEYLLSGRLLLFTDTEVLWSCQDEPFRHPESTHVIYDADSTEHSRNPFRRLPGSIFFAEKQPVIAQVKAPPESGDNDPPQTGPLEQRMSEIGLDVQSERKLDAKALDSYLEWTTLVSNYSRRRLTVLSDRLPALSGVAEKFQEAWGGEKYYAGLWPKHFVEFLSWRHDLQLQGESLTRPSPCGSPSWSWASVEGPIKFEFKWGTEPGKSKVPGAELVSCLVEPAVEELPLGEVKSGYALLEGQMVLAINTSMVKTSAYERGNIYWDELPVGHLLDDDMKDECWCMLLGEAWMGLSKKGAPSTAVSLIVVPTPGEQDTFRRVGLYTYLAKNSTKAWSGKQNRRRIKLV